MIENLTEAIKYNLDGTNTHVHTIHMNRKPARGHHGVFDLKKLTEGWWKGSAFVIIGLFPKS
jgi:hypothetical protein